MGAPKTVDVAAWSTRLAKGWSRVLAYIENGINAMPPNGTCLDCSDDDAYELVQKMSNQKISK